VAFSYATEFFSAWLGGNLYERAAIFGRAVGPYAWAFWTMALCNVLVPQVLWSRRVRACVPALFVISILVNVGMWFERFVIIVTSLHQSYLPSTWVMYTPTMIEIGTLLGSFGLFFTCFLLFIRLLPMIAIWEIKAGAAAVSDVEAAHG
jgi:Ni/Fe-hydrogenase subunit HybB-like protein